MDDTTKQEYIARMVENLPVLRAKLKLTQKDFADLIGVSNYSVSGMESGQRKMTWNTFMSILPVFLGNSETAELLEVFGIYTGELEEFLHFRTCEPLTDSELDGVAAAGVNVQRVSGKDSRTKGLSVKIAKNSPQKTAKNTTLKPAMNKKPKTVTKAR